MKRLLIAVLFLKVLPAISQVMGLNSPIPVLSAKLPCTIIGKDTVPMVFMDPIWVLSDRTFQNIEDASKYYELKRDVKAAYPYAILIQATFDQCEETMKTITDEKEQKKYLKQMEQVLKDQYTAELKALTINQGRLLIKLIDRQTGNTSYELVKELKGSFCAFMWQTVAFFFGNNMKAKYDPEGDDKEVEHIIQLIEAGAI